nr:UvrD-helicase domain-containing protein [Gluconacetobacter azotocaptans]
MRTDVFARLTPEQLVAARLEGAVVVLAGAGTGKTATLVAGVCDRIERRKMRADRILAVTFTNKAAREMRERIASALGYDRTPAWVGTFHAHGCRQLRRDPGIAGLRSGFEILSAEDAVRLVRRILKGEGGVSDAALEDDGNSELFRKRVKRIAHYIGDFKERLIPPDEAWTAAGEQVGREQTDEAYLVREAARIYPLYQAALREANAADYGDLLLFPTRTMAGSEEYRREWAGRFDAVMVDEFQDVNLTQYRWLRLLARDHGEFFAVGDDAQSIYGWRGANIGYIRNFLKEFPHGRMVALERNFRSTGHILDAANAIIALDPHRLPKTLYTEEGAGEPIKVVAYRDGNQEARGIAGEIGRRAATGIPYHHIAVLYRYNYLSRVIEEQLLHQQIPYVLVGDTGFWQRGAVKDALSLFRLSVSPYDRQSDEAFRRVVNVPRRGVGGKTLAQLELAAREQSLSLFAAAERAPGFGVVAGKLQAFLATIHDVAAETDLTIAERIERLLWRVGYFEMLRAQGEEGKDPLENLNELLGIAENFSSVENLFDHAALGAGAPGDGLDGRVRLMTIHGAKGLEFPEIFLPGWESTLFPQTGDNVDQDEERRLAYVALTRPMKRATISWCAMRGNRPAEPSRFIEELPPACAKTASTPQNQSTPPRPAVPMRR